MLFGGGRATMENGLLLKDTFVDARAKCAYTGVELTFKTAAAGHRIPVSRGGQRTAANVEWMTAEVARMKGELLPEELLDLCARVARTRGTSPAH